ncbi:YoaK family protein [Mycobacterium sp. Aquia_213]|uniref:YoaK family protein n=1 Tax=Mycobacterium sp. Aquia_213 TaxID=2991728 RepID=UPI0022711583|nr:YoaK family protein [Mycobacterium sp. Aquia_213]WAC91725.1 YoaK family protein [Mycobacterium sp. Aquia_213]
MPPPDKGRESGLPREGLLLGYSAVLALSAGFVNAVALLILALPVGNLTAITTQLGMNTANPWLYEGHVLAAILFGFLAGATMAGAVLAPTEALAGPRHAVVLFTEAALLVLAAAGVEDTFVKAEINELGIEQTAVQAMFAATALGLQNAMTSSFRGMAIRTTHFTGTVTDLGLMLGRSRQDGIQKWKAAILVTTLVLFLGGGIAGIMFGVHLGGYSLLIPAATCAIVAGANVLHSRGGSDEPVPEAAEAARA